MQPIHKIRNLIRSGDYVSPHQLWHDYEWPRIYTKAVITRLAKQVLQEDEEVII